MPDVVDADSPQDFASAFGNALNQFLVKHGMRQSDLVELLGLDRKKGKARISSYCREGRRPKPDAEILYLACSKLPGFHFDYRDYRISAATLNGNGTKPATPTEQLPLVFEGQFNLTDRQGTLAVKVKRPPGRIEVSLSLKASNPKAMPKSG